MTDDLLRKLGLRVRELRTARRLTQGALAEQVGFRASYFSHIENGVKGATIETLAAVAAALGVTLSELFLGVDQPIPPGFDRLASALAGQSAERQRILLRILEDALRLSAGPDQSCPP
jgi:transcriptional regulator with XRE-family HTH domain